jgi:hypothetical protein
MNNANEASLYCTVTRIDGKFHQLHRMAPDQTIRVMESDFDICNGQIHFFRHYRWKFLTVSKFSDYIPFPKDVNPRHFEIFRLYSLFKGWNAFDLHIEKLIWLRSHKKILVYGKKDDE